MAYSIPKDHRYLADGYEFALRAGKTGKGNRYHFRFQQGRRIIRATEKCNGSGDCRKSHLIGGTMCPSYMATRDERTTTRARANILREYLTNSTNKNPFSHREMYDVLDLCLSCKGCKSECPSNVDMARYKADFSSIFTMSTVCPSGL